MPTRKEVYEVIDGERDYQARRWNHTTTSTGGEHSITEFLVYMRDYVEEALHHLSRNADPEASQTALHSVRKVTALGVACMEQNGALSRQEEINPQPRGSIQIGGSAHNSTIVTGNNNTVRRY